MSRIISRRAALAAVLGVLVGVSALDLGVPSDATARPDPVEAGPAVGGAWYCAAGASDQEHSYQLVSATPPGAGVSSVSYVRMGDGVAQPASTRRIFAGTGHVLDVEESASRVAFAARWLDRPAAVSRVWDVRGVNEGTGVVSGPCAARPSPTWYVAGMSTAGGASAELHILNPFAVDASVAISFTTSVGAVEPILLENVSVLSHSVTVVDIGEHVPRQSDVGVSIVSRSGRVVVEGVQYLHAAIGGIEAAALVPASEELSELWTIPFSITDPGSEASEGPSEGDTGDGGQAPAADADSGDGSDGASEADEPVSQTPVDDGLGLTVTSALGSGTASWVWISNPGEVESAVTIALHTADGITIPDLGDEIVIRPGSIVRVDLRQTLPASVAVAGVTVSSQNQVPVAAGVAALIRPEVGDPESTGFAYMTGAPAADDEWIVVGEPSAERLQVLTVVNPNTEEVTVDVGVWNGSVYRGSPNLSNVVIPPGAMIELAVTSDVFERDEMAAHVVSQGGPVVVGRHSRFPDSRRWIAAAAVPGAVWAGGDVVPPVVHDRGAVARLGTRRGLPNNDDLGTAPVETVSEPAREEVPSESS